MLLSADEIVLSRHRLPQPYRSLLALLWMSPTILLGVTLALTHGLRAIDARLLTLMVVMLVPGLYVWREGIDTTPNGIICRIHRTRRYRYGMLTDWDYRENAGVLRVWDETGNLALECYAAHLTAFEALIVILQTRIKAHAADQSDG
ncbi:MAG: hypothetical protein KJ065_10575 [Anaerolineae bacterium]|nr:hypothetical protein [Anaerolineae bacterium]